MQIIREKSTLRQYIKQAKHRNQKIGFVPTMGALHEGHLSLIRASKQENNDLTVCSIFVNPTQFNNLDDFINYPSQEKDDIEKLLKEGCDAVFIPTVSEMYPSDNGRHSLSIHFGKLETVLEGKFRPGHFNGVALIVSKLFHLVEPDKAYFGQKDLQQCLIVRKLVEDLGFPVEIVVCPIVRENDGLAMSSRNLRLSPAERKLAPKLYETLLLAKNALLSGNTVEEAQQRACDFIAQFPEIRLEYLEIVDKYTLDSLQYRPSPEKAVICIAAYLGKVRLIDNLTLV